MNAPYDPQQPDWKLVAFVVTAGAIGGFLAWIYAVAVGDSPDQTTMWIVPAWALLGMGASFIGVYLIANTDTRHVLRCLGFAMVCGFSWQPIYEAGRALVDKHIQQESKRQLNAITEDAQASLENLKTAESSDLTDAVNELTDAGEEIMRRAQNVSDYESRVAAEKRSREIVSAISARAQDLPKEIDNSLNALATTAIATNQPKLAEYTLAAMTSADGERPDKTYSLEYLASLAEIEKTALAAAETRLALLARQKASEGTLRLVSSVGADWEGWDRSPYAVGTAYKSLNNLAYLYMDIGDQTAAADASAALRMYRSDLSKDPKIKSILAAAIAQQCYDMTSAALPEATATSSTKYAEALKAYQQALEILRKVDQPGTDEGDDPSPNESTNGDN